MTTTNPTPRRVWFSSDLHFGHAKIIDYCLRPHRSVGHMDADLVARWNTSVGPDDTVFVLGDVVMGPRREDSLRHVSQLAGRKILVLGNHDGPFRPARQHGTPPSPKTLDWAQMYLNAGFIEIIEGAVPIKTADIGINVDGVERLVACHFPYRGDSRDTDRYVEERPVDTGQWLLHGHCHDAWRQTGRQINVGVDAWGGAPVAAETIAELIAGGETHRAPLPWTDWT